ncbi:MAG: hypothetical protein IJE41_00155, partial [Clostridia bacterium]|nr:hypothetical protein [Clostridia bacterium]
LKAAKNRIIMRFLARRDFGRKNNSQDCFSAQTDGAQFFTLLKTGRKMQKKFVKYLSGNFM